MLVTRRRRLWFRSHRPGVFSEPSICFSDKYVEGKAKLQISIVEALPDLAQAAAIQDNRGWHTFIFSWTNHDKIVSR
jgi:hypothetical protein